MSKHDTASGHGPGEHISPVSALVGVWGVLVVLTVITVWTARQDFGPLNLWVALGIATTKAALVVLYFMHLRYDRPFNAIVFVIGILFVGLFIGITLIDTTEYQPTIRAIGASVP